MIETGIQEIRMVGEQDGVGTGMERKTYIKSSPKEKVQYGFVIDLLQFASCLSEGNSGPEITKDTIEARKHVLAHNKSRQFCFIIFKHQYIYYASVQSLLLALYYKGTIGQRYCCFLTCRTFALYMIWLSFCVSSHDGFHVRGKQPLRWL